MRRRLNETIQRWAYDDLVAACGVAYNAPLNTAALASFNACRGLSVACRKVHDPVLRVSNSLRNARRGKLTTDNA